MRYPVKPILRRYVTGHGFLSFARKFGNGTKLIDTATKIVVDALNTASKGVMQKTKEQVVVWLVIWWIIKLS